MSYAGDYAAGDTVTLKFTTRRFSTGAPFALAGTPAVSVYKGGSTTQSTAGVTLTTDFDTVTGLNHVAIDTTADGTFYADGSQFDVVITAGTVDSVSVVGEVVGRFTLRAQASLYPTTAGRTLDVTATGAAGIDWGNVENPTTTVGLSGTTVKTATDVETDTADIQTRLPAALTAGGNMKADALAVGGSTTAATNMVTVYATDFATNYNSTDNYWYSQLADNVVHGGGGAVVQAFSWLGDWTNGVAVEPTSAREAVWNATTVAYSIAGTFGKAVADILADTAEIGTAGAGLTNINLPDQAMNITGNITGNLSGSVGSVTGAVGSVTGNVGGSVTGTVGGIAGTITTLDALDTAQDTQHAATQAAIADVPTNAELTTALNTLLTTAMTESYNADGAAPTPAQALFVIMQMLTEMSIAGTTMTVKKLDGTTTAFTLTLNDATTPTSVTRAT